MIAVPRNAFHVPIAVTEADVDRQGRVSNVTIVKWMSQAAFAHSEALGYDLDAYRRLGAWFVIKRHEVDYHAAALAGDQLIMHTWPCGLRKVTAQRRHVLIRPADGQRIAEGLNTWAFIDIDTHRPRRIPHEVAATFDPARFSDE